MLLTAIFAVVLCTISCVRNVVDDPSNEGLPVSLTPSFGHSGGDQSAATRVTSTDFEAGDALGLYVVADGREFEQSGNAADNARMEVSSGGAIAGNPRAVYYPDQKRAVSFYSYYPYAASVGNVRAHRFAVSGDQSVLAQYKAADFCYGQKLGVTPSTSAQSINYAHKLSQVLVNVTIPNAISGKKVASVALGVMFGVENSADVNLTTGAITQVTDKVDSVVMHRAADVTAATGATTTHFAAVVPAQTFAPRDASSGGLIGFSIKFEDNSELYYIYYNLGQIVLTSGSSNTLNLVVGDRGDISLSGEPVIGAWASVTESGIITQPINNSFTAIWKLPIKEYKKVNRVVLGINDPISGTVKEFETTDFSLNADNSADKVVYKFNFVIGADDLLSYPYTIDYVEFFEDQTSLRKCQSVIAANVTRRGAYTIGVDEQYVVAITSGTVENWDDLLYGDITRGVDNDFRVSLIEYPHYADIATIKLRIDGEVYTFNDAGCVVGSNVLVATTKDVRFPDANGRAPYKYPFTIENVALYNSSGALVADGSYPATVSVNRAGLVTLRLFKGVITSTTATVTGYNTSGGLGRPDFGGAVENNPLRIVYCYGAATAQLSCLDVEKVELVINNQTVTLAGYKALMTGTVLAAQSSDPQVNIAEGTGSKPTTYPYYISKITLRKADGTMLFSSALDAPLKVDWYGQVTIEIMEKMAEGIPEAIEMNGIRWATGNLVADGKGGCKIGAPGDGGIYFQYGGLIGYKGGTTGDGRGIPDSTVLKGKYWNGADAFSANDISVTPAGYNKPKDKWPYFENYSAGGYGYYYYNTLASKGADFSAQPNGYDPSLGVGDPCTHYLGGDWRMPNYIELSVITGSNVDNSWVSWSTAGVTGRWEKTNGPQSAIGAWFGPNSKNGSPTVNTDLFIPAAGFRSHRSGEYSSVGAGSWLWSSSIQNAINGYYLPSNELEGVIPRRPNSRAFCYPVRCVQGKKKVTEPIPPSNSDILVLNGLKWTKGNLVAAGPNNARVGAPGDGGLYFQYGGLIGYKGGATGDGTGSVDPELQGKFWDFANTFSSNDVALTPSGYTKPTDVYPNFDNVASGGYGYYYYNTLATKYADFQKQANGKDVALGIGDPCELYLGSPWRMPNYIELSAITGSPFEISSIPWSDPTVTGKWAVNGPPSSRTKGAWFGPNSKAGSPNVNTDLFVPISGYRIQNGFNMVGVEGLLWNSSVYDNKYGYFLHILGSVNLIPNNATYRSFGFPVRCVADDVVEIGGVKWAKGNLVANGPSSCVIGKPGDGGLYFQYGSLIGYKGGATGDGTGICNAATHPNGKWWGGAAAYSAADVAVKPATYVNQATWPFFDNVASGGFGYYYFNTFVTKYADFQAQANANNPTLGIGDPCAHYLGSSWRLPTVYELSAITGSTTEGAWAPWSTAGVTGRWEKTNGPKSAIGAWFGPNSRTGTPKVDTDLFIPASGHRNASDGTFYWVGTYGYLWSSSAYDGRSGFDLDIHESNGVCPRAANNRARGFPVRCVKN